MLQLIILELIHSRKSMDWQQQKTTSGLLVLVLDKMGNFSVNLEMAFHKVKAR